MSIMNDTHSLERTLDYCDKSNDHSFLNSTNCSIPNNVSISTLTTTPGCPINAKAMSSIQSGEEHSRKKKSHIHFNRLWSVWYGILVTILQGYLVILGLQKYLGCSLLKWKNGMPATELNMQLIFCGLTLLFLPLFLASALFKIGNLANDGIKLSSRKGTCTTEQQPIFGEDDGNNSSTMKSLWMHGVPISVFIHIITALCLLLPHLLLEAKLIQNQHLPKDNIWNSEIDFIVKRNDRLVILSFINSSPYQNDTNANTNAHETRFDDSIESLDYDLNPFETHESLQSHSLPAPTESIVAPTVFDSVPIQISTFADDYDFELPDIDTTMEASTLPPTSTSTLRSTTTKSTIPSTTTTTTTTTLAPTTISSTTLKPSTTTVQIITTEKPTLPTTVAPSTSTSTVSTTLQRTSTLPTTKIILSTTTQSTSTLSTLTSTEEVTTTEKPHTHHHRTHHKTQGKTRKHKKKHHQHVTSPPPELEDVIDDLEIKPNKEYDFDREIHMVENPSTKRRKIKNKSSERLKNLDSMERPRVTQKTLAESPLPRGKTRVDEDVEQLSFLPPSTSASLVTENSKIFEIKAKSTDGRKTMMRKRSIAEENDDDDTGESSFEDTEQNVLLFDSEMPSINEDVYIIKEEKIIPAALISSVPNFTQSTELEGIGGFLQSFLGCQDKFDPKVWFQKSPSVEFLNLALALLVWSVRYPSVFWDSSKAFTLIFSLQMLINSIDVLLLYVGTSILFKLEVVGQFMTVQNQPSPLLLNGIVTLALTLLAYVLIIASSMILYLYGHSRLSAKIRDCQMITLKDGDLWSYFSHCASLCFILGISVVKAPIIHDLSIVYRMSLDKTIFIATMASIVHIFLWIIIWLTLTAKRQWSFKLPVIVDTIYATTRIDAIQPLLTVQNGGRPYQGSLRKDKGEETIYWPSSPKLKVTFDDEVPSTLTDRNLIPDIIEHDGKRTILSSMCTNGIGNHHSGETDEGEYATLKTTTQLQISEYDEVINLQRMQHHHHHHQHHDNDGASEDGKLLECVQNESVTYASTRDLEPPQTTSSVYTHERYIVSSEHHLMSPMAPVTVQVHSELHTSTPRFLRRGDSGMPPTNEALTPKSDTNSTESSTSPPERALSESSSGVHSSEESKDEVLIRAKANLQKSVRTPAVIQEEDIYGRITNNHKMSSFKDSSGSTCNTLPTNRSAVSSEHQPSIIDYSQCNTMPLMPGAHQIHRMSANDSQPMQRTTLPNNVRYSSAGHYLRQMPQLKNSESPYATGLGSGHHTFSPKLIQNEPLPAPPILLHQQPHHYNVVMPQSQSQQQFSMTTSASAIHHHQNVHHFNTSSSSSSFNGGVVQHNPYQMVLNELCASNTQTANFPPPPPPLTHQMH